ncbi:uncharacterized protein LOC117224511 [Megalopta genalis]|uniref:uncharacterized protein LOC117224511 n=1 Tax=Megalopta genalis TaxID=115081 RepID=UPI00144334CD|nr:uncharacterized protein LOC117224511 [Megalopta genalis]
MTDIFDIELFIEAIKKYPEIWDTSCENYHDKNMKILAWFIISKEFYPNIEGMSESERNGINKRLIHKWKNIKDAFMRSIRKRSKSGQGADCAKQYIYYNQLSFLLKPRNITNAGNGVAYGTLPMSQTEGDISDSTHNDIMKTRSNNYENTNAKNSLNEMQSKRRRKEMLDQRLTNCITTPGAQHAQNNYETQLDEDRAFFDSLLPTVRSFNIHHKLEFRTEVLKLVKNMININQPQYVPQYTSQHPSQHPHNSLNANAPPQIQVHQASALARNPTPHSSSNSIVSINSHNECTENLDLDDL